MAVTPSAPQRREPSPRVKAILDALGRTEERVINEFAVRRTPDTQRRDLNRAVESAKEGLRGLLDTFEALALRLEGTQRGALQQMTSDMDELRQDLHRYTAVMAVAVVAVLLLLAVLILFKVR